MAIREQKRDLNRKIDRLLREQRPDRYVIRDTVNDDEYLTDDEVEGTEWLDAVAEEVEGDVPSEEIRRRYARSLVGQREGMATQKANGLLRKVKQDGQLPLGWMDFEDYPISVVSRIHSPGERVKIVEERVALRAVTSGDLRAFAVEERRRAARDFAARNEACEGAEWIAEQMDLAGAVAFADWAVGYFEGHDGGQDPA